VKRAAERYNRYGAIAKKHGMKILIHNHAGEFDVLEGSAKTEYDILLGNRFFTGDNAPLRDRTGHRSGGRGGFDGRRAGELRGSDEGSFLRRGRQPRSCVISSTTAANATSAQT
jgi:hypothetical protein